MSVINVIKLGYGTDPTPISTERIEDEFRCVDCGSMVQITYEYAGHPTYPLQCRVCNAEYGIAYGG